MTHLKESAIKMIQDFPEDKMVYVLDILKSLNNIFTNTISPSAINEYSESEALEAWEGFKKYKGIIHKDIDEKEELLKALDEKYANFD